MPADAAPLDQQVIVFPYAGWKNFITIDFFQNVYDRADALTDLLSDPLVRLDKNFKVHPAAATEWSVDDSGLVWTFKLDPNLMWNDGTPVTADDYVATFQYGADPNMPGTSTGTITGVIKNWTQAVAGEVPVDRHWRAAVDANRSSSRPRPRRPTCRPCLCTRRRCRRRRWRPAAALYNSDPATSVSAGPYKLTEWTKTSAWCMRSTRITRAPTSLTSRRSSSPLSARATMLPAYQNNEIDYMPGQPVWVRPTCKSSRRPELTKEYHPHYGDFRTHYFFFDTARRRSTT